MYYLNVIHYLNVKNYFINLNYSNFLYRVIMNDSFYLKINILFKVKINYLFIEEINLDQFIILRINYFKYYK